MSENERKFLLALVEDGSRTDVEIARETGMSKATANRIRNRFEEDGVIHEYLPIVDLEAADVRIYSIMIVELEEAIETDGLSENPNVIFLGETDDFQQTLVLFTGFKGFNEYHEFIRSFKDEYSDKVENFEKKLISPDKIFKEDFTHLIKHNLKEGLEK